MPRFRRTTPLHQRRVVEEQRNAVVEEHDAAAGTVHQGVQGRQVLVVPLLGHLVGGVRQGAVQAVLAPVADVLRGLHYVHELCDYDGMPFGRPSRTVETMFSIESP